MTPGFPIHLTSQLCCTQDGTALEPDPNCRLSEDGGLVEHGALRCRSCTASFAIEDGILNMLSDIAPDDESRHEQKLRDEVAVESMTATRPAWYDSEHSSMEMISTLEALSVDRDKAVLELGCGGGRFTTLLADRCRWIVAVDFSIESLRVLRQSLQRARNVGLVLGDVTTLRVRTAGFDRVLSTLVSNLPTRAHRNAMYALAAHALGFEGRFVFSTHNHGIRQKLKGEPKSGRYGPGGIHRRSFTVRECKAEARPYFKAIQAWPIRIYLPLVGGLRLPRVALSRLLERVPLINDLGDLVLCTAERPIRSDP